MPLVIGHRGAAGDAPENTPAAFALAVDLGVDAVEFDVQFSADGVPVVFHDETLTRMAGVAARISDHSEAVLSRFDVGFLHGKEFRGERIPTVAEVARIVPARIGLHVELKDYEPVSEEQLTALMETLERHGGLERVIISSPHEDQIEQVKKGWPEARAALLLFRNVRFPRDAARRAALLGCVAVNPNYKLVDSELMRICHRHKLKVFAFTVNERGTMRKLMDMGVDGFYTDYPKRIKEAVS